MCPDRHRPLARRSHSLRSSWGELAFAGVLLACGTGVALAVPYDVQRPYDSLAWMLLSNPAGAFFRNLHYWAGQLVLLLTLAHTWDHLSRSTESRLPRAVWWRVVLSLPLTGFVMLSGFMLKGDAEAQQALRIVAAMADQVPFAGPLLSAALFGTAANRQVLYVHHVATASVLLWLVVAEHARAVWPRAVAVLESFVVLALVSLFASPALHDGLDPIVKGPWYFLGLQEALHWTSQPIVLVAGAAVLLVAALRLPRISDRAARLWKVGFAVGLVAYAGLTVVGLAWRGENWTFGFTTAGLPGRGGARTSGIVVHGLSAWAGAPVRELETREVPVVLGRREGCLFCHPGVAGLSAAHRAEAVGCASCHLGNPFSLDKATAHAGIVLIPGGLGDAPRTCGTAACHPSPAERVPRSLMASMAGIVAVDRALWGGRPDVATPHVESLGYRGADGHLRQLCASCHLGAPKRFLGPVGEDTRGGGCLACHLSYSAPALADLRRDLRQRAAGRPPGLLSTHPNLSIGTGRVACFGCHSRSGRISTSYEGWHETTLPAPVAGDGRRHRTLADGRVFVFVAADIHAVQGMDCADCHTSREVMGDGMVRSRAAEAVRVACEDCHLPAGRPRADVGLDQLDAESRKIAALRKRDRPGDRFLVTANGREPLLGTLVDERGLAWLTTRTGAPPRPMKPPARICVEGGGHARLSCVSCHGAWAPRCPSCHTAFDPGRDGFDLLDDRPVKGTWVETPGEFRADPPTLGVRAAGGGSGRDGVVDTFVPGMVLTLDRREMAGAKPDPVFRRMYARLFAHTVAKGARTCQSCHADPVALGYGEGKLEYTAVSGRGRWTFTARYPPAADGLPGDAWTGFLQERTVGVSTRPDVRPFSVEEQKRILTVGACLTCHRSDSSAMRGAVANFKAVLARVTGRCVLPAWN
jgi:quinol-cytochrome oxidoreductase complex cytochrome b subunit